MYFFFIPVFSPPQCASGERCRTGSCELVRGGVGPGPGGTPSPLWRPSEVRSHQENNLSLFSMPFRSGFGPRERGTERGGDSETRRTRTKAAGVAAAGQCRVANMELDAGQARPGQAGGISAPSWPWRCPAHRAGPRSLVDRQADLGTSPGTSSTPHYLASDWREEIAIIPHGDALGVLGVPRDAATPRRPWSPSARRRCQTLIRRQPHVCACTPKAASCSLFIIMQMAWLTRRGGWAGWRRGRGGAHQTHMHTPAIRQPAGGSATAQRANERTAGSAA